MTPLNEETHGFLQKNFLLARLWTIHGSMRSLIWELYLSALRRETPKALHRFNGEKPDLRSIPGKLKLSDVFLCELKKHVDQSTLPRCFCWINKDTRKNKATHHFSHHLHHLQATVHTNRPNGMSFLGLGGLKWMGPELKAQPPADVTLQEFYW